MATIDDRRQASFALADIPSHGLFSRPPPRELFHYTSLDGARGIIEGKALRLTKAAYLNDSSELGYGIRLFREAAERIGNRFGSAQRRILDETGDRLGAFARTNICVASFCEHGDLLSQWRAYGSRAGRGLALGFRGDALGQLNRSDWAQLFRCVYEPAEQNRIVEELIEVLLLSRGGEPIGDFDAAFLRVAPVLKDPHFSEEMEWRLVTMPREATDPRFRALVTDARVTQYYLHEFAPDADGIWPFLESVVVGPTREPELIAEAIGVLCRHERVRIGEVRRSAIPYRG